MKFSQMEKTEGFQRTKKSFWDRCVRTLYDEEHITANKDKFIFGLHPKITPCPKLPKGGSFGGRFVHPEAVGVLMYASAREGQKKRQNKIRRIFTLKKYNNREEKADIKSI